MFKKFLLSTITIVNKNIHMTILTFIWKNIIINIIFILK